MAILYELNPDNPQTRDIEEITFFGRHYELDENDRMWAASNSLPL